MTDSSISALLSKAKKYTWKFYNKNMDANISAISFSVEKAREEVLSNLTKNSVIAPQYKLLEKELWTHICGSPEYIAVKQKLESLEQQLDIDSNTECFSSDLLEYTPSFLVKISFLSQEITLEKLIFDTDPVISKINTVSSFTPVNIYTWKFDIGPVTSTNPLIRYSVVTDHSSISVSAYSLTEARETVIANLRKISALAPEYKDLDRKEHLYCDTEDKTLYSLDYFKTILKQKDALNDQFDIICDIDPYCTNDMFDYLPTLMVTNESLKLTLEGLIYKTDPTISKLDNMMCKMSIFSKMTGHR
jgi:hypothetical protein